MDLQALIALRKYLTINKHNNGEIQLAVSMKVLADNEVMELVKNMKNRKMPKAILGSKFDLFSRKIVLKYDVNSIIPSEFDEILTTRDKKRFEELASKYNEILSA